MGCSFIADLNASIKRISLSVVLLSAFSRCLRISGVQIYLPIMPRFDGAFSGVGFSMRDSNSWVRSLELLVPTMP